LTVLGNLLAATECEELEADVKRELDDAVEFARDSPLPDPSDALRDVYA
jgi:pyruvate dehydrogenase E1 component alpha subunit